MSDAVLPSVNAVIRMWRGAWWRRAVVRRGSCAVALLWVASCDRSPSEVADGKRSPVASATPVGRVVFPASVRVDYAPVNEFITRALSACVRGDYESFRSLWSAKQEPLRREEFEQGWRAVKTVRVRAVEKVVLPSSGEANGADQRRTAFAPSDGIAPDVSFVLLASAEFDPSYPLGRRRPTREFVLLILREQNEWRFGRASGRVREWIKQLVADEGGSTSDVPRPSPP